MANNLERDWAFVRAARDVLEDYLLSGELFWNMGGALAGSGGMAMLQLTLGNLMLSLRRLSAVEGSPAQQAELATLTAHVEAVGNRWRANWSKKAAQEYRARLKQWAAYLQELYAEEGRRASGYAFQVRSRAILTLLEADLAPEDAQNQLGQPVEAVTGLDRRLRAIARPADFVWEAEVQPAFPPEPFWYLYVQFPEKQA